MLVDTLSLADFAKEVSRAAPAGNLAILAGAGVSMAPPSSLPSGNKLRDLVVREIARHPALDQVRDELLHSARFQALLPELTFQRLFEHLAAGLAGAFELLSHAEPNPVHDVLAALGTRYATSLYTTNFDLLLEEAGRGLLEVTHLHGRLDQPKGLVHRLNQVVKGLDGGLIVELREKLAGKQLLVLGYSGRDRDVMGLLTHAQPSTLYWLLWNSSDPAMRAIEGYGRAVVAAEGDALDLAALCSDNLGIRVVHRGALSPAIEERRRQTLEGWGCDIDLGARILGIASLLLETGRFKSAASLVLSGGADPRLSSDGRYLTGAAAALRITADFDEGLALLGQASLAATANSSTLDRARSMNTAGLLLLEGVESKPTEALTKFKEAIDAIETEQAPPRSEESDQLLARIYNNLGHCLEQLGRLDAALPAYSESLMLKRRIGDLPGVAQSRANLSIALYKTGHFHRSSYHRGRAIRLIRDLDLRFLHAYLLRRTGIARCEKGRLKKGRRDLLEALEIAEGLDGAGFDVKLIQDALRHYQLEGPSGSRD